jgi:renalase
MSNNSRWPVAVVGAGIAGLSCARTFRDVGIAVEVLEAEASVGGRCACVGSPFGSIDLGAAFVSTQQAAFGRTVDGLVRQGQMAPWHVNSYTDQPDEDSPEELDDIRPPRRIGVVGVPTLATLAQRLAVGLTIHTRFAVREVTRNQDGWFVIAGDGRVLGPYSKLVFAIPAPILQTIEGDGLVALKHRVRTTRFDPCWVLLMAPRMPILSNVVQRSNSSGPIHWVGAAHRRPGSSRSQVWILHASARWSAMRMHDPADQVASELVDLLHANLGSKVPPVWLHAHLWPNAMHKALAADPAHPFYWDDDAQLGLCGDSVTESSVEAAYMSGQKLALEVLELVGGLIAA